MASTMIDQVTNNTFDDAMSMSEETTLAHDAMTNDALLRKEIVLAADRLSGNRLAAFHAKIKKKNACRQKVSLCRPAKEPVADWQPKHPDETALALKLMIEGKGVRSAPYPVSEDAWEHKFFTSDVAQLLLHSSLGKPVDTSNSRAVLSLYAVTVATVAARVVEEAMALTSIEKKYTGAKIAMQKSREDAGWDRTKTRGSGVVFDDKGKQLFSAALQCVAARCSRLQQEPSSATSASGGIFPL
jgi:hypothetical protein